MISEIAMPSAGARLTAMWTPLKRLIQFHNALRRWRFEESRDWGIEITDANVVLRVKPGGGVATVPPHPWQPFQAADPFQFWLYPGFCNGRQPVDWEQRFTAPANCAAGYFVWLIAAWNPASGISSLTYGAGTTLPVSALGDQATGAPPALAYQPLCFVTTTATGIDRIYDLVRVSLTLETYISAITCTAAVNSLRFKPLGAP